MPTPPHALLCTLATVMLTGGCGSTAAPPPLEETAVETAVETALDAAEEPADLPALPDVAPLPDTADDTPPPDEPEAGGLEIAEPTDTGPPLVPCTPKRAAYTVDFAAMVQVASDSCAGTSCHVGGGEAGGLQLDPPGFYANTVGVKAKNSPLLRVHPGRPDKSYLYRKLTGQATFSRMPLGGPYLDEQTVALFREWIEDCASENAVAGEPSIGRAGP